MSACCGSGGGSSRPTRVTLAILAAALLLVFVLSACTATPQPASASAMNQDVASRVGIAPDEITTTDTVAVAEVVRSILSSDITEESAVRVALLNNRSAVAIYEQIGLSQAEVLQAGLLRNPVFSGNAKFFSGATEIEFGLSQPFLDIFLMPLRSRVAA